MTHHEEVFEFNRFSQSIFLLFYKVDSQTTNTLINGLTYQLEKRCINVKRWVKCQGSGLFPTFSELNYEYWDAICQP